MGDKVGRHARVTADSVGRKPVIVGGVIPGEADEELKSSTIIDIATMIQYVFD